MTPFGLPTVKKLPVACQMARLPAISTHNINSHHPSPNTQLSIQIMKLPFELSMGSELEIVADNAASHRAVISGYRSEIPALCRYRVRSHRKPEHHRPRSHRQRTTPASLCTDRWECAPVDRIKSRDNIPPSAFSVTAAHKHSLAQSTRQPPLGGGGSGLDLTPRQPRRSESYAVTDDMADPTSLVSVLGNVLKLEVAEQLTQSSSCGAGLSNEPNRVQVVARSG